MQMRVYEDDTLVFVVGAVEPNIQLILLLALSQIDLGEDAVKFISAKIDEIQSRVIQ